MTNYEKIKSMTIDEMVEKLSENCSVCCFVTKGKGCEGNEPCNESIKKYLESEAE